MANIAQSLIGDLEHITVANPGGVQGVHPTLPNIKFSMKMMRPNYFIFIEYLIQGKFDEFMSPEEGLFERNL